VNTPSDAILTLAVAAAACLADMPYPVVDTGQLHCYDDGNAIEFPKPGERFHGQDAQYTAGKPTYKDNGNGTVSDLVTGLMWQQDPGAKVAYDQAVAGAAGCRTGGYDDWRLPTIKELYSLMDFSGIDPDPSNYDASMLRPFIDKATFKFRYGNEQDGERIIDSQFATSTRYVGTTMHGNETMFGVNFADGRIKGYPIRIRHRNEKTYHVLYVRGNPGYGKNRFEDNGNYTITDHATGLTWTKADSGKGMDWPEALAYAESLELAGNSDWRLPNAKELQSIVDYTRSPDTTGSAAIDPVFDTTEIRNESGKIDFPWYWTSTSHTRTHGADAAVYVAFGRALGWMPHRRTGERALLDVHGAGSQRSDPKVGDASRFPYGRGPQGDVIRIENFVRCVRGGNVETVNQGPAVEPQQTPRPRRGGREQSGPQSRFIDRLDRNGDGKVGRNEFDGPPHHFDHVDRNEDGFITTDEAPNGPPPPARH